MTCFGTLPHIFANILIRALAIAVLEKSSYFILIKICFISAYWFIKSRRYFDVFAKTMCDTRCYFVSDRIHGVICRKPAPQSKIGERKWELEEAFGEFFFLSVSCDGVSMHIVIKHNLNDQLFNTLKAVD